MERIHIGHSKPDTYKRSYSWIHTLQYLSHIRHTHSIHTHGILWLTLMSVALGKSLKSNNNLAKKKSTVQIPKFNVPVIKLDIGIF